MNRHSHNVLRHPPEAGLSVSFLPGKRLSPILTGSFRSGRLRTTGLSAPFLPEEPLPAGLFSSFLPAKPSKSILFSLILPAESSKTVLYQPGFQGKWLRQTCFPRFPANFAPNSPEVVKKRHFGLATAAKGAKEKNKPWFSLRHLRETL